MVFERKVLMIFGPAKERDGTWRIKTNEKLGESVRDKYIINLIKSTRINLVWPFTWNARRENGEKKYISGNRC
jgi:hypothetical protein